MPASLEWRNVDGCRCSAAHCQTATDGRRVYSIGFFEPGAGDVWSFAAFPCNECSPSCARVDGFATEQEVKAFAAGFSAGLRSLDRFYEAHA